MKNNKKKIDIILALLFLLSGLSAQQKITMADGHLTFYVPDSDVIVTEKWDTQKIYIHKLEYTNDEPERLHNLGFSPLLTEVLAKDGYVINEEHILEMIKNNDFSQSGTYSLSGNYYYNGYHKKVYDESLYDESYTKLFYNSVPIGESYFWADTAKYPIYPKVNAVPFCCDIWLVVDNRIINIGLWLYFSDLVLVSDVYPDLFRTDAKGDIYWKDEESRIEFYYRFMSDDYVNLPTKLRTLRETYDMVIETLTITD